MNVHSRYRLFSLVTLWVLLVSLALPLAALAEDGTPPTEEAAATETTGGTEGTTETTSTTEEAAATEEPAATEEATVVEEVTVSEVLEAAPEGTDLVVLDENGEVLPLATEEAAAILVSGDPTWCPEGQTPGTDMDDLSQDCIGPYDTFNGDALLDPGLLSALGGASGNGTIYIAYDYDYTLEQSNTVTIDGSTYTDMDNLTIQGGWDFFADTLYGGDPFSYMFDVSLAITNWDANVFINNIVIDGSEYGLDIDTTGDVGLKYVRVDNTQIGNGIDITAGGDVSADNVEASNNFDNGMHVDAGETVSITESFFTENGWMAYLCVNFDCTDYESGSGLHISYAGGDVTLSNILASENANHGVYISTDSDANVTVSDSNGEGIFGFYGNGWLGSYHEYSDGPYYEEWYRGGDGLYVETGGDVMVSNVESGYNALHGAELYSGALLSVLVEDSDFYSNGYFDEGVGGTTYYAYNDDTGAEYYEAIAGNGLYVNSPGEVMLDNVSANYNANHGAEVYSGSPTSIIVNGGSYIGNGEDGYENFDPDCDDDWTCYYFAFGDGLHLQSTGEIQLDGVTAVGNYGDGASLFSDEGSIELNGGEFSYNGRGVMDFGSEGFPPAWVACGEFGFCEQVPLAWIYFETYRGESSDDSIYTEFDAGDGVDADTRGGNISLFDVTAEFNTGDGADMNPWDGEFNEFWYEFSGWPGGAYDVLVDGGSYNDNGWYPAFSEGDPDPYIDLGLEGWMYLAFDSECESFFDCLNYAVLHLSPESGIDAFAVNDITLNEVTANDNALHGAELYNEAKESVLINSSTFSGNGFGFFPDVYLVVDLDAEYFDGEAIFGSGAYIETSGNATVNCSTFTDNLDYGVNADGYVGGAFALNSNTFSGNGYDGLQDYNGSPVFGSTDCEGGEDGGGVEADGGPDVPTVIVPVTGGVGFLIDCANPEIFSALMEDEDQTLFDLLCGYYGLVEEIPQDELPGELPDGSEFVVAHTISVLDEFGNPVSPLPAGASITPSFIVEDEDAEYAILFWNGDEWVEVEGGELNEDGFFAAEVDYTGTFVLVMK